MEWTCRDYRTGAPTRIAFAEGKIVAVETLPATTELPADEFVSPGWLDIQVNGYGGVNFGAEELDVAQVAFVVERLRQQGVTRLLPTITTQAPSRLERAFRHLAAAAANPKLQAALPCFHLEGPFISPEDGPRGAHPRAHCLPPNWDLFRRLQDAAGGLIRLVTLAPELPGSIDFMEKAIRTGVRIAIGHTGANREQILAAIAAGATLSTHLGNGAHDQLQRHHNYIYDQLGDDRLLASLILDGHHLPPHLARIFVRAKDPQRVVLISDAVEHAGLPPGIYEGFGQPVEVRDDGFIGIVGQPRLAGSGLLLRQGIENMIRFAGASLAQAIDSATSIPARFLGLDGNGAALGPSKRADLVRFRIDPSNSEITVIEVASSLAGDQATC